MGARSDGQTASNSASGRATEYLRSHLGKGKAGTSSWLMDHQADHRPLRQSSGRPRDGYGKRSGQRSPTEGKR
jgi:hypothetical protein